MELYDKIRRSFDEAEGAGEELDVLFDSWLEAAGADFAMLSTLRRCLENRSAHYVGSDDELSEMYSSFCIGLLNYVHNLPLSDEEKCDFFVNDYYGNY